MNRPFSVAVYCSSSDLVDRAHVEAAEELGRLLAARGWRLVYGAGGIGLMGALARAARAAGGSIYGVIPHALDRVEVTFKECDELLRVETMRQRKALMEENADAFIGLPGGFGTLEEIIEVLVLKQLGYIDRAIVLLNTLNYWDPLVALFEEMIQQKFVKANSRDLYRVAATPQEALDYIAAYRPASVETQEERLARTISEKLGPALE